MTTPTFTLPTSGSDPKRATKEGLEENINYIIQYLDNARISGDAALMTGLEFQAGWDASTGTFPDQDKDGNPLTRGDFFWVVTQGTFGGTTYNIGEPLVALTDNPSTTDASDWYHTPINPSLVPILEEVNRKPYGNKYRDKTTFDDLYSILSDGDVAYVGGYKYKKDSSATGSSSCTNDISADGWVPFGKVHVEHYGEGAQAWNAALANHKTVHAMADDYELDGPVREATNGGGRRIVGDSKQFTRITAADSWPTGMIELNGNDYTVTVIDDDTFTLDGVNSTGFTEYADGGVCLAMGNGVFAQYIRITGATQAATCSITAPNHLFTTGDTVRIEAMSGPPMFWFGNSNGHGAYRLQFSYCNLDANNKAIGLRAHEAGLSEVLSNRFRNCVIGLDAIGIIGSDITRNEFSLNTYHLLMSAPKNSGDPIGPDNIAETDGALTIKTNINTVDKNWFNGGKVAMVVAGGLTQVISNTMQAVGDDATLSQVVFDRAQEALSYGGGPIYQGNWTESGTFKAMLEIHSSRKVHVLHNFFAGSSARSFEQGILADSPSSGLIVMGNSFFALGSLAPTEGRTQNAYVYAEGKHSTLMSNHYAGSGTYSYDELIVLNRTTTANNIVIENGQNGGTPFGVELGNMQFDLGATPTIRKNPNTDGAFNAYVDGIEPINVSVGDTFEHSVVKFASGSTIRAHGRVPDTDGDTTAGDIWINTASGAREMSIYRGATLGWKKFLMES